MSVSSVPVVRCSEVYPAVDAAVSRARHLVCGAVRGWSLDCLLDDAALIVTELAANAVQHCGGGEFRVGVSASERGIRIEVSDTCGEKPAVHRSRWCEEGGRGMLLVDTLASRWGSDEHGVGKTVWADLFRA